MLKGLLGNWLPWFNQLSFLRKCIPICSVLIYWSGLVAFWSIKPEQIAAGLLILVLSFGGVQGELLLWFVLPALLSGVVYDSQHYFGDQLRGQVHVIEPYLFDKTFFGIQVGDKILTPNEWWQVHTHPALDFVTGFFYIAFVPLFVLTAAYFRFSPRIRENLKMDDNSFASRANGMMWSFLWVNLLGYSTYYWYSAAPPWYVSLYGLGPAKLDTLPSAAGCLRFDALIGWNLFEKFYQKSADTFGAVPSLHIAYPLIAFVYSLRLKAARIWSLVFFLAMCFSAVYLNHHYVLDILWGAFYAVFVSLSTDAYLVRKGIRSSQSSVFTWSGKASDLEEKTRTGAAVIKKQVLSSKRVEGMPAEKVRSVDDFLTHPLE